MKISTNENPNEKILNCPWCLKNHKEIEMVDGKVCVNCFNLLKNASVPTDEIFSSENKKYDKKITNEDTLI